MVPNSSMPGAHPRRRLAQAAPALLYWLLSAGVTVASAQGATRPAKPDPLDAQANVPALTYRSTFAPYRRIGDDKPIGWRDANDTVTRIGGWRAYIREAQQPDPPPASPGPGHSHGPKAP